MKLILECASYAFFSCFLFSGIEAGLGEFGHANRLAEKDADAAPVRSPEHLSLLCRDCKAFVPASISKKEDNIKIHSSIELNAGSGGSPNVEGIGSILKASLAVFSAEERLPMPGDES
jgi:hypothetical protein